MNALLETPKEDRLTLRAAAKLIGISGDTIGRWCRVGIRGRVLKSYPLGARCFVLRPDLERFVNGTGEA